MLETSFLQHLGPQNFSHDLVGSLKEKLKQRRTAGKLGCTGEAEIPVMRECTDPVPQLCTDTQPLIKAHKVWGAGMWSLPSHSGSEPLGQPHGARGEEGGFTWKKRLCRYPSPSILTGCTWRWQQI